MLTYFAMANTSDVADPESLAAASAASEVEATESPGSGLLYGLSAGHGIKHFAQGSFLILIPDIRASLGLSDIAVGGLFTAQQIASGIANGRPPRSDRRVFPSTNSIAMKTVPAASSIS